MKMQIVILGLAGAFLILNSPVLAIERLVPSQYSTIQAAIDDCNNGDVVIAEPNIYTGPGNRDIDFKGLAITVRSIDPEDPCVVATTVIDCQNSGRGFYFHNGEESDSIVDGLTITNGYVTSSNGGGGVYCNNGSPTISRCIITENKAIINNDGHGGGISCFNGSSPVIKQCVIINNSCDDDGGGVYCHWDSSNPTISNCLIADNIADGASANGGGIFACKNPNIRNCTIAGNWARQRGGGLYVKSGYPSVTHCIVWGNSSNLPGNGIYESGYYHANVSYSDVQEGHSGTGNINTNPFFVNPATGDYHILANSPCINAGDPCYSPSSGEADIDNEARILNSHIDIGMDEVNTEQLSIGVWPRRFEFHAIVNEGNPETKILFIYNKGGFATLAWNVIEDVDWLAVDPNSGYSTGDVNEVVLSVEIAGLTMGTYDCNLTISDPCAENNPQKVKVFLVVLPKIGLSEEYFEFSGVESGANPSDQILIISNSGEGTLNWVITENCDWLNANPSSGSVPEGASDDVALNVNINGLTAGTYDCSLTISDPNASNNPQVVSATLILGINDSNLLVPLEYPTIQAAIDDCNNGDTVIVAPGTYTGAGNRDLDFGGKAITVRSTDPNDPNVVAATVIDCENSGRGFYFHSGEGPDSVVAGLTITNGYMYINGGGGICCTGSSPTIKSCIITNNWAHGRDGSWDDEDGGNGYGGGIFCNSGSNPRIVDCYFSNNMACGGDGDESDPGSNGGHGFGGGICSWGGNPTIQGCEIISNYSAAGIGSWRNGSAYGGGVYCLSGSVIRNCLVVNNEAASGLGFEAMGGGINAADTTISNCTIYTNYGANPDRAVGGVYGNGTTTITNCILWRNGDDLMDCSATYSCIQDDDAGEGNINADPCFVSGPDGDYYLSQMAAGQAFDSPCVDAGSDTAANLEMDIFTTRTDEIGDAGVVDMGYHYPAPIAADISGDLKVDLKDFTILASQWQQEPDIPSADIAPPGGDGFVNVKDLAVLVDTWLWEKQ